MDVDTVLFDLGGVICHFLPQRRIDALADACGIPAEAVERALYEGGIVAAADRGDLDREHLVQRIREELAFDGTDADLEALWVLAFEPDDDVIAIAGRLRPGLRRGILTNNDQFLMSALRGRFPTVANAFERLFFSGDLGACKPDAEAYHRALALMGSDPERTLFIDDSERNVTGAREAGLTAVRFTGAERLRRDLGAYGVLIDRLRQRP